MSVTKEANQVKWRGVRLAAGEDYLPVGLYQLASANNPGAQVSVTTASTTILAANASRLAAIIKNMSSTTVYVKFGTGATTGSFELEEDDVLICDVYTGIITGIVASGSAIVSVVEV